MRISVEWLVAVVLAAFAVSLCATGEIQAAPGWPVYHGDNGRTGTIHGVLGIKDPGEAWRRGIGGSGNVFIGDVEGDGDLELLFLRGGGPVLWGMEGVLLWDREPMELDQCSSIPRMDGNPAGVDFLCKGVRTVVILDGRTGEDLWTLPDGVLVFVGATWFGGSINDPYLVVGDRATGHQGDGAVHTFRFSGDLSAPEVSTAPDERDYASGLTVTVVVDQEGEPAEFIVAGHTHLYTYDAEDGALLETLEIAGNVPFGIAHIFVDYTDSVGRPDLIFIRDFNRPYARGNSVSRIVRGVTGSEESFRREWHDAVDQNCPESPVLVDGRVATSIREPESGWSTVFVDTHDGKEVSRYSDRTLLSVFHTMDNIAHLFTKDSSTGTFDVVNDAWLFRGSEPPRNLGARGMMQGMVRHDPLTGIGRLEEVVSSAGIVPLKTYKGLAPIPAGIEILDLETLEANSTISLPAGSSEVIVASGAAPVFAVTEEPGTVRIYDQQGKMLNPATVQGDPAPMLENLRPRYLRFDVDEAGQRVLAVQGNHSALLTFFDDASEPASVLYTRSSANATFGRGGATSVMGVYNVVWSPDTGLSLVFRQANGNLIWSAAIPELEQQAWTGGPLLKDFDGDGVDDILLFIFDILSDGFYLFIFSGSDGSRLVEPFLLYASDSTFRGPTLLPGDVPRMLVKVYNTLYVVAIEDGAMSLQTSVVDNKHTGGLPIVLDEATPSGVRVVMGGTRTGMVGYNEDFDQVWAVDFSTPDGRPVMAAAKTPSGVVVVVPTRNWPGLVAIDADSGSLRWTTALLDGKKLAPGIPEVVDSASRLGSVTGVSGADASAVFVGSTDGHVYAVDAETGMLRFSMFMGGGVEQVIPADVDGDEELELLVAVKNGRIVAIDNAELPGPEQVGELPPLVPSVVDPAEDIDVQESAEKIRVGFSAVAAAKGYEVRLLSQHGNLIVAPKFATTTEVEFQDLGLPLEAFVIAEVRTKGEEAFSEPKTSDGVRVRDLSPPIINDVLVDGVVTDGLIPRAPTVLMSVVMEDLTRLGEISLRVTISRDGTQLAKAVEVVGRPERKLTLKVPLGDLAVDEQIRVEARAADLGGHVAERSWVLRLVDGSEVTQEDVQGSGEGHGSSGTGIGMDASGVPRASPEEAVELDDASSSSGSSSCSAAVGARADLKNVRWHLLLLLCTMLLFIRSRAQAFSSGYPRREGAHERKNLQL